MTCPQCARWIQLGLAILTSSFAGAVNAATLDAYPDYLSEPEAPQTLRVSPDPTRDDELNQAAGAGKHSDASPRSIMIPPAATETPIGVDQVLIAQITPDATLGAEASVVTPNRVVQGAPADLIEGGATRGSNLFHSFQEFNVNTGQQVYFANPVAIENILSRVTGSNLSTIDGLLGVAGAANLFLLNPNGVIFGPNARLDISGSFTTSTAESFAFADGSEFVAVPQGNELLSVSVPLGVQFNDQPQGDIASTGELTTGQDLTLLGNQLYLEGQLIAGEDLTLQAQDTVTIRDTATEAFITRSGDDLTIQGNQGIDIWTLQHLESTPLYQWGGFDPDQRWGDFGRRPLSEWRQLTATHASRRTRQFFQLQ